MYKSNATLLLVKSGGTSTQDTTLLNNYVQLFQSRRVLEPVIERQKLGVNYDQFKGSVSASNDKGTELLRLSVSTNEPNKSRDFLNAAIANFKKEATSLYDTENLVTVDSASDAIPPYNVKKGQQLAIASGAGFVVSLLVLFFIYDARGGKVENWGKKHSRAVKAQPAPRTQKAKKAPASDVVIDNNVPAVKAKADVNQPLTLWGKLKQAAQRGLWIDETTDVPTTTEGADSASKKNK